MSLDSRLRGNDDNRLLRPFQTTFVIPVTVGRALMPDLRFFQTTSIISAPPKTSIPRSRLRFWGVGRVRLGGRRWK